MNIKANYDFFMSKLPELISEHFNKYVVISDCKIIKFYDDFNSAVNESIILMGEGNFIVQKCAQIESDTLIFHSRVFCR